MEKNRRKHTLADRLKVYRKRFNRLDKKTKIQIYAIGVLLVIILALAIFALTGRGKNPTSADGLYADGSLFSGSYDPLADSQYQDYYTQAIQEYSDVLLPENNETDRNYFRETLFIGDSNTEGLAAYNHLSLQYVMGVTGMPIQSVTTSRCIWFVGYEEPVTMPVAVGMLKPRRIIINFGTNNAGGTETDDFIQSYENALAAITKAYPYADIIVESVLPVAKSRSYPNITMQDIDEFNLALAEMCRENDWKFLNTAQVFKDPNTGFMQSKYVAKDGIHLNSDGYKLLLDYVGSHKYITEDTRPARGSIPTRRNPPREPSSSSSVLSSSLHSSSIMSSSSMPHSSSVISSSSSSSPSPSSSSSSSSSSTSTRTSSPSEPSSSSQEQIPSSSDSSSETVRPPENNSSQSETENTGSNTTLPEDGTEGNI